MAFEFPLVIQCEGSWLVLSGCGEVIALGVQYEDAFGGSFVRVRN